MLETAKEIGVPHTYVHFFGDGRDTAPSSAAGYCQQLLDFMSKEKYGEIASIIGRYYAMDRDKRWDRIKIAVEGLVKGEGESLTEGKGPVEAIKASYEKEVTDEFLKPIIVNGDQGRIKGVQSPHRNKNTTDCILDGDSLFFFNYRSDRVREIVTVFGLPDKPLEVDVPKNLVSRFSFQSEDTDDVWIEYYNHVSIQC